MTASLALRYTAFAVLATLANLGAQRLVLGLGGALLLAMVVGTGLGLVVKYALDKRWIFDDRSSGLAAHSRRFSLYTLMGVATTLIFWGFEATFWHIGQTQMARETGAVLGLGVGYGVKYVLDRRFVFTAQAIA
jgi:putative flippase GtrA